MSEATRAVFLSYAREDTEAARRIAEALRGFGVEVWFDQSELRGGDSWDAKIKKQIRECALFLPLVSAHTEERSEGYFRREWLLAVERTRDMAAGRTFIVPVVIDDTPEAGTAVPEEFMRYQWTRLTNGEPTPDFVTQVKRLLETPKKPALKPELPRPPTLPPDFKRAAQAKAGAGAAAGSDGSVLQKKVGFPGWPKSALWLAILMGAFIGVMIYWATRAPVPGPAALPKSEPVAKEAPAAIADKSIAVLPFTNMSEDKDNAFFADGIHEDVLTNLALIRELRVVSRTSVMPYRTTAKPMKQIAQELGVTYILEGSVRRSGNKVRVTGQLIHAATDEHVWASSYDRELTDIFTIQAELSRQIAGALKTALSPEEKILIARRPTENPAAYDKFLQARDIFNREASNPATRQRRAELLQAAVALDPAFAAAWGELAVVYAHGTFLGEPDMDALLARAKEAIDRAVQLAPEDPDVITSLGTYYYYGYRDYTRATEQYDRFVRQQPNSPRAFYVLGLIQRRQGRWAEALANHRRAIELDPGNAAYQSSLVGILISARRWDEALVAHRRLVAFRPGDLPTAYSLAYLPYTATGSRREGEQFFASLTPEQFNSPLVIQLRKGWTRDRAEAIRLDKLQPYYDGFGGPRWEQAMGAAFSYFALGDREGTKARLGEWPAELRTRVQREPGNFRQLVFLAAMEMVLGNKVESRLAIDRAAALMPPSRDAVDGPLHAFYRALIYGGTGEKEIALAEFTRLLSVPVPSGGMSVHELRNNDLATTVLRGDPRWEALLNDPKNNQPLF